jgi:uncharacterized protein (TIGR03435 family)
MLRPLLVTWTVFACMAFGQPESKPRFEVASVKPSSPASSMRAAMPPGRLTLSHMTLRQLTLSAWSGMPYLISGGPAWIDSDTYDIVATLESQSTLPAPPAEQRKQLAAALQLLLEERFKLRIHKEMKTLQLYNLTVAKSGFLIKQGQDLPQDTPPGFAGNGIMRIMQRNIPISQLARMLSGNLGVPVEDKTGLQGTYSISLEWRTDEDLATPGPAGPAPVSRTDAFADAAATALRKLGLNLVRGKGPVETIVIDHAEKPTAN